MRKTAIALLALAIFAWTSAFASNPVRISIVYGGGGNSGAYYRYDFVELFNSSSAPINIGGWAILYATAANSTFGGASNYYVRFPAGAVIPACGYYLIQCASGANASAQPLPVAADAIGNIAMSATACKIGLSTNLTSGTCASPWVDLASVASSACWEGAGPSAGTSNTTASVRNNGGLTDTDNNNSDFTVLTCNASLPIHNSTSPTNPNCVITGACCGSGVCTVTTAEECAAQAGEYLGDGIPCDPGVCVTATKSGTWGRIKTIYR